MTVLGIDVSYYQDPAKVPYAEFAKHGFCGEKLAWIAGLLEGEGTFYAHKVKGTARVYPRIRLAMNDRDVVERFAALVGGRVGTGRWGRLSNNPIYFCHVPMRRVLQLATALLPHMGARRRAQIESLLGLPAPSGKGGEHNAHHKLTIAQVRQIRAASKGISTTALAREFGVGWGTINDIRLGKSWRCLGN